MAIFYKTNNYQHSSQVFTVLLLCIVPLLIVEIAHCQKHFIDLFEFIVEYCVEGAKTPTASKEAQCAVLAFINECSWQLLDQATMPQPDQETTYQQ